MRRKKIDFFCENSKNVFNQHNDDLKIIKRRRIFKNDNFFGKKFGLYHCNFLKKRPLKTVKTASNKTAVSCFSILNKKQLFYCYC